MEPLPSDNWLEIGRIVAPQGLNGEVRVYPDSDFPERFVDPGDRWLLKAGQAQPESVKLVSGRYLPGKGLYVVKFQGIDYRDQAEALRDARLVVAASDRLPLAPDEFHVADLIGLTVRLQTTGAKIGKVVDLYTAGNDLLAIQLLSDTLSTAQSNTRSKGKNRSRQPLPVLVPFVEEIVPTVDLSGGYVVINPPQGLIPELLSDDQSEP
ncbi:MAG: ribosome maturation factor RimM [Leptolyngbyaceae cyanobacterium]